MAEILVPRYREDLFLSRLITGVKDIPGICGETIEGLISIELKLAYMVGLESPA